MKKASFIAIALLIIPLLYGFAGFMDEQAWVSWGNRVLTEAYDPSGEPNIAHWEIALTTDHFIRIRKTYQQGNQAYYSFNIKRIRAMNYQRTTADTLADTLQVRTLTDDIIIQTFDDPNGDLDSVATSLKIPVVKLSPARLDSLKEAFTFLKKKGM
ncbi:hypothetical protein [Mucilaginibacter psychrotolerans]|uniref:Uncharacterized protein n=1 Tax=Mucilaginibacter psychrotolerans TaxID=1524096 RepID=A0A4Y8SQL3_9SPHI|nr:hypothetical protein [Mucilaginibacter psychrotolerans]TFF40807.1 hypothetical protein E2R66_01105 [Mucilaginibacter psychrotolerans]